MRKLNHFFEKVSERLYNENNLSDITWAMIETMPNFGRLFLSFFFNESIETPIIAQREFTEIEGARPDFYFEANSKIFIVEIKKYDKNTHFKQYLEKFRNVKIGFLSINQYSHKIIKTKTWKELYDFIHQELNSFSGEDKILITGYLKYLKNVCNIIKIKTMNLSKLKSLFYFNALTEEIINNTDNEKFEAGIYYGSTKPHSNDRSGKYFELVHKSTKQTIHPWFGVFYNENEVNIYIYLRTDWCNMITEKIFDENKEISSDFKRKIDNEKIQVEIYENSIWIGMNEEKFNNLNVKSKETEQKEIINEFYYKVLDIIAPYFVK